MTLPRRLPLCLATPSRRLLHLRHSPRFPNAFLSLPHLAPLSTLAPAARLFAPRPAVSPSEASRRRAVAKTWGLKPGSQADRVVIKVCPACPPTKNDPSNHYKLAIFDFNDDVEWNCSCLRCNFKGRFDVLERLSASTASLRAATDSFLDPAGSMVQAPARSSELPDQAEATRLSEALAREAEWESSSNAAIRFLVSRGLKRDVCVKYKLGAGSFAFADPAGGYKNFECVTLPWIARPGEFGPEATGTPTSDQYSVLRTKVRGIEHKSMMRLVPSSGSRGLFGWHTLPPDCTQVVLTEGEFDALAVHQETGAPALSVPNGAHSLPPDVLPALKRFKRVILWFDDDKAGVEGCEAAARKLGLARCLTVRLTPELLARALKSNHVVDPAGKPPKDANDLLRMGYDLKTVLDAAEPFRHDELLSFHDLRDDVRRELVFADSGAGALNSRPFPTLSKILGGHRKGELTIVTGPTGSGKTTFLSQLSIDYCLQGVPTLWGSFEIKNTRLIAMMMKQMAYSGGTHWRGTPPPDDQFGGAVATTVAMDFTNEHVFKAVADEFASLDLFFLRFFGATSVDKVVEALDHAVAQHDVQLLVLDNLQFMISGAGDGKLGLLNKFDAQERALDCFRSFATKNNVHIVLVMHPKKGPEGLPLTLDSIGGTAKASQEADNILIMQRSLDGQKTIEIKKNRFSGELGAVALGFNRTAKTFRDLLAHGDG